MVIPVYPDWLNTEAWEAWEIHRKEIKKRLTPLAIRLQWKLLQQYEWQCDICKAVGIWGPGSQRFTSILLDETCPEDVPYACSDKCAAEIKKKLDSGEWALPRLARRGYYATISHPRKGY